FAIARLGAVILPIDRRWTRIELCEIVAHFGCSLVLAEPGDDPIAGVDTLVVDMSLFEQSVVAYPSAPGGDLPLVFSLSSGTTGRPKGALLTHANYLHRFMIYFVSATFNEHDRFATT